MKRKAVAISLVVAALVIAVGTVLLRPPSALVGPRINAWLTRQVKQATGRDLLIKGPTSVSLLPRLRLKVADVTLSGPPGRDNEPLLKAKAIEATGDLLSLVKGSRALDKVSVEEPVLALVVDEKGKGSWQFDVPGTSSLSIATLELTRGSLSYADARNGANGKVGNVEGALRDVSGERVGAFSLKNGPLQWSSGSAGSNVASAVDKGSLEGEGISAAGISRLGLNASQLTLRAHDDSQVLTLDGATASVEKATSDTVGALSLKSTSLRYAQAGGTIVAAQTVAATMTALSADRVGSVSLAADRIGLAKGDERPGFELAKVETKSEGGAFSGPLATDFAFDWNRERVTGNVRLASPATLNEAKPIPLAVTVAARSGALTLDGTLTGTSSIDGKAVFTAKSLRELAGWLGTELPKQGPLAATRIEGKVSASPKRVAFADAEMSLDSTKAKGSLAIDLTGPRPRLTGTLAADLFDADAYGLGTAVPAVKRDIGPAALGPEPEEPPPVSLKDALKVYLRKQLKALDQTTTAATSELEPTVEELTAGERSLSAAAARKPKPQPQAWSDAPIDLAGLKAVDLDMALSVGKLKWSGVEIGVPDAKAQLNGGALKVEAQNLTVKGGKVSGRAEVDAASAKPRVVTNVRAENVEALDVFAALGVTDYVAGKSVIEADLAATAASQKDLVESVSGNVKVKMAKGAIVGYDFGDVVGAFFEWLSGDLKYDAKRRSPFDKLEADMMLTNGVAKSNDMRVDGPVISLTSDGTAKLPAREIDYRARVNLAAWFQPIAVRIFGDWKKPSKAVDVFDFSRNPGAVASPMEVFRKVDVKDAELAGLITEILARAKERPLPPHMQEFLTSLQARAEGRE